MNKIINAAAIGMLILSEYHCAKKVKRYQHSGLSMLLDKWQFKAALTHIFLSVSLMLFTFQILDQ